MKTALTHRNSFAALVFVPAIALAGVAAVSLGGMSAAEAQELSRVSSNPGTNTPGIAGPDLRGFNDDGGNNLVRRRPCEPGAVGVNATDCTPWTPPAVMATSEDECECKIVYNMVNGQRVATKDCYVLLPTHKVHYCTNPLKR